MKTKSFLIGIFIFIIAALTGWIAAKYVIFSEEKKDNPQDIDERITEVTEDHKTIKIFLPVDDRIIDEEMNIQKKTLPVEIVEIAVKEYLRRFQNGLKNTELLGVYMDRNNNIYLDFSGSIKNDLSGDTKKEYLFLKGIYKTITNNISDVEDIKILIDGKESDTICGHLYILYGLRDTVGIDE